MVHGSVATGSTVGNLVEMQNLKPHPDLLYQNLHFNNIPGDFYAHYHWRSTVLVHSTHSIEMIFKSGLLILKWQFSGGEKKL